MNGGIQVKVESDPNVKEQVFDVVGLKVESVSDDESSIPDDVKKYSTGQECFKREPCEYEYKKPIVTTQASNCQNQIVEINIVKIERDLDNGNTNQDQQYSLEFEKRNTSSVQDRIKSEPADSEHEDVSPVSTRQTGHKIGEQTSAERRVLRARTAAPATKRKRPRSGAIVTNSDTTAKERRYTCDICSAKFRAHSHLKTHKRIHTGERPFSCDECDAKFAQLYNLKVHKRTHTEERPFTCEVCYKSFGRLGNLRSHKLTHTGEKAFSCEICNKKFTRSSHIQRHKLTHSGEKAFSCEVCDAKFSLLGNMKRHRQTHTDYRPFKCELCYAQFKQSSHLKRHELLHTGNNSFNCDVCVKVFSRLDYLKRHNETHHSNGR